MFVIKITVMGHVPLIRVHPRTLTQKEHGDMFDRICAPDLPHS